MSCCRSSARPATRPQVYDQSICRQCSRELVELFRATAMHQTRGSWGESTVIVRVNCPTCNAVNQYRMTIKRQRQTP